MAFAGVQINKLDGGLGGGEVSVRVAVLVAGVDTGSGHPELNKAFELLQIEDAEALGITPESDVANKALTHYHLSEVFRLSPETRVYLVVVDRTSKVSDLKNLAAFITALRSIPGVNTVGMVGLEDEAGNDISLAVQGAQLLVDGLAEDHVYIDAVLIQGRGAYLGNNIATFPDLRALDCENVSVIIGCDPGVAAPDPDYADPVAVGSALGMLLVRSIHENLGSVDIEAKPRSRKADKDYMLTDVKTGRWLSAGLSSGNSFESLSASDQRRLDELGYIYAGGFSGYGGYFFSNSHTCTEEGSDYCFIERNAIWNRAARIIRETLIPRIRSKVQADPATGYIKSTTITDWDGRVRKALEPMKSAGDVADFDIYIDPKQAAVSTRPFNVKVRLVADGVVHEFEIDLGFTKSI